MSKQIYFIPLGGCNEIGMNMSLYGLKTDNKTKWLMIDCGITFTKNIPGIEIVCPDIEFIKNDIDNLEAIIITHAHEDHIGALPYLWHLLKVPIYLSQFALQVLRNKLAPENDIFNYINIIETKQYNIASFNIEFISLTHSIPEAMGVLLRFDKYNIFHTGDWKIDDKPSIGNKINKEYLNKLSLENIDLLVCDSTNVFEPLRSGTELSVRESLFKIIANCQNAIAVTTFASNIGRLVSILEAAKKYNRKICLLGRSMRNMILAAQNSFGIDDYDFINEKQTTEYNKNELLYLCTGSQGEANAALNKIANGNNRFCNLSQDDTVIFSSKKIPGNELFIHEIINKLIDKNINVILDGDKFTHVSGHPCQDELSEMYDLIKPKNIIPVHGEPRHLEEHCRFAKNKKINALSVRNGDVIQLLPKLKKVARVNSGRYYLDGKLILQQDDISLSQRQKLAFCGIMIISLVINKNKLTQLPEVEFVGISDKLISSHINTKYLEKFLLAYNKFAIFKKNINSEEVQKYTIKYFRSFFTKSWGKKPNISVLVNFI